MRDYLQKYSRVVDERDESNGLNNFTSPALALAAGHNIGVCWCECVYSVCGCMWCEGVLVCVYSCMDGHLVFIDRKSWKSGLTFETVMEMPEIKALLTESEASCSR